ncbi:MAG: nucleoside 2-deoxyribosyltransferase [Rhodospirillaceae bacterium]|nr:nucleoside 2-deoxyribosyltransferase [Rhodospirillaceae bacterium]
MRRIYLAGPDVFLPDPQAQAAARKALCARYGFAGVFPLDGGVDLAGLVPVAAGLAIARANEELMRGCDLMIANATPFRGPSLDAGTAYEMGFMRALGKPVLAYANVVGSYADRVAALSGRPLAHNVAGHLVDDRGMAVEAFDMADNLMVVGAVAASGGELVLAGVPAGAEHTDLTAFEHCLEQAARLVP